METQFKGVLSSLRTKCAGFPRVTCGRPLSSSRLSACSLVCALQVSLILQDTMQQFGQKIREAFFFRTCWVRAAPASLDQPLAHTAPDTQ